jgi:hypothetical protein
MPGGTVPAVAGDLGPDAVIDPLDYPFDVPRVGYVWRAGEVAPGAADGDDAALDGRTPVLAIGSNAAPAQLSRKFSADRFRRRGTADAVIPVTAAVAPEVDVVYAAHVARYGSVPATLAVSPGARAHVFVTWLTPAQLERMNDSEALGRHYDLVSVGGVRSGGRSLDGTVSYVSVAGVARFDGRPLALSAVQTEGRTVGAASQLDVWRRLAADLAVAGGGEALVARVVADPGERARVIAHLRAGRPAP